LWNCNTFEWFIIYIKVHYQSQSDLVFLKQLQKEFNSLKQYCLTPGNTPWNPLSFSDQIADKFYQQAIDDEQKSSLNTKSDHSSDTKTDLVENDIPNLQKYEMRQPSVCRS
jgi:hypothetical protein